MSDCNKVDDAFSTVQGCELKTLTILEISLDIKYMKCFSEKFLRVIEYSSLAFLILLLGSYFLHSTGTIDIYWQLRAGIDLIRKNYSPLIDHYSTGHYGHPIQYIAILYQAFIASVHEFLGGFTSVHVLHFLARLALVLFAYRIILRVVSHPLIRISLLAIFVACIISRSLLRAELFSQLWILMLCEFLWTKDRILKPKEFILLCFSQVIWVHFHPTGMFGYLIMGSYLLDRLWISFNEQKKEEVKVILLQGLAFLATGFINPLFVHPLVHLFKVDEFAGIIQELKRSPYMYMGTARQLYICFSLISIVYLLRKKSYFTLWLCAALLINIFVYKRMFVNYLVITFPLTVRAFQSLLVQNIQLSDKKFLKSFAIVSLVGALIYIYQPLYKQPYKVVQSMLSVFPGSEVVKSRVSVPKEYPYLTPEFFDVFLQKVSDGNSFLSTDTYRYLIKKEKVLGNVLNDYENGAMVQYFWGDKARVILDGRAGVLYSLNDFKKYKSTIDSKDKIIEYVKNHDVEYFFLSEHTDSLRVERVLGTGVFGVEYLGRKSLVFKRAGKGFLNLSKALANSQCILELNLEGLNKEKQRALEVGAIKNAYLIDFITGYLTTDDRNLYLSKAVLFDDPIFWQMYSYLTWKEGLWNLSYAAFQKVKALPENRFFIVMDASLYLQNWDRVRNGLHFMNRKKIRLSKRDYGILYYLANRLNKESGKKMISDKFIQRVKEGSKGRFEEGRSLLNESTFECSKVASSV